MKTLRSKRVKTRKEHICFACLRLFPPGTEMMMQTIAGDDISTIYTCETCDQLIACYSDFTDDDDCYPWGCVSECMAEFPGETPEDLLDMFNQWEGACSCIE